MINKDNLVSRLTLKANRCDQSDRLLPILKLFLELNQEHRNGPKPYFNFDHI